MVAFVADVGQKEDYDTLAQRFRELAFLNRGVRIVLLDERNDKTREFFYEGGIVSFVEHLNRNRNTLHSEPIFVEGETDPLGD